MECHEIPPGLALTPAPDYVALTRSQRSQADMPPSGTDRPRAANAPLPIALTADGVRVLFDPQHPGIVAFREVSYRDGTRVVGPETLVAPRAAIRGTLADVLAVAAAAPPAPPAKPKRQAPAAESSTLQAQREAAEKAAREALEAAKGSPAQ